MANLFLIIKQHALTFHSFFGYWRYCFSFRGFPLCQIAIARESLKQLVKLIPHPVVLIGGLEEKVDGEELALVDSDRIINTCGIYSLHESAAFVRDARLVFSHDTGMLYIACAFEKNVIAIWGATSPALQVEPCMPENTKARVFQAIVPNLTC